VLIARDSAFHFLYPENIRRLEEWGNVHYFSPLEATGLPVRPDLIYLPGGYPELYLEQLAGNGSLLEQIRAYASGGGKVLAECGGMMYLGRAIVDQKGQSYPMADILGISTGMEHRKLSLGYRTAVLPGGMVRGHEFHYSQYIGGDGLDQALPGEAYNARGERVETPFFYTSNLLATYMHLYWGEEIAFLESWLNS
jgi:cobyrinic acid a,c-diamide synthase